jgi:transcriptional regulator with PAS, ATPase and Fis domain
MMNDIREIITADPEVDRVIRTAKNIAASRATVLIIGESGCGKELLARYIHQQSIRNKKNFVAVNCAAVPEGLLESELFGYEKGAFTGANNRKIGKFELANEGSFLLDEISEMPMALQAKILRVLQESEVERLGGNGALKVDVRLIATTNKELSELVDKNQFRSDLYYRLNVVPLRLPPLRARPSDVELLAKKFVLASCAKNNRNSKVVTDGALEKLRSHQWPGNIRELQNVIERSVLLCEGDSLTPDKILISEFQFSPKDVSIRPGMSIQEAEDLLIQKTLEFTKQNKSQAARLLGISVRTLRNKLNEESENA